MSLIDVSSKFSFSNTRPWASPCGRYVAYIHSARLIVRDAHTLERVRTVALAGESFVKVEQICWEPAFGGKSRKLMLVISNSVRVFDVQDDTVDVEIVEDEIFGVDKVSWLSAGNKPVETAYKGSKQLVVYSECGLMVKIYSLDYKRTPVLEIAKPLLDVVTRPGSDLFSVVSVEGQKLIWNTMLNNGSTSHVIYATELKGVVNLDKIIVSPGSKWLACRESVIGKIGIALFSVMGDVTGKAGPLFKYNSEADPLGALDFEFLDDDTLLIGDHKEIIHVLKVSKGFTLTHTLTHKSTIEDTSAWRQNSDNTKFLRRAQPSTIPQVNGLPLQSQGIYKIKINGEYIFSVAQSMPTTVFVWNLSKSTSPIDVITTNTRIRDIVTVPSLPNFFLIYTDDSICLGDTTSSPVTTPISLPFYADDSSQIRGVQIITMTKTTIQILVWTSTRYLYSVQSRLSLTSVPQAFESMDTQEISLLRRGSPVLTDDSSRVMELAAGVQQSEWGQNLTKSLQVEDTFVGKKKARRIDQLIN